MHKFAVIKTKSTGINPLSIFQVIFLDVFNKELKVKIQQLDTKFEYAELKGKAFQTMIEIAKKNKIILILKKVLYKTFQILAKLVYFSQ